MAQKGKIKLRELGRKKSKAEKSKRMQATPEHGNKRFYKELRLKEKAANERMRQLELQDIKSPAYQAVQAQLEMLGKRTKGDRGRRFSETGKATYNEMELLMKMLDDFLGHKTSKLKGAKEYYDDVWASGNKNNKLEAAGITRDQWFDFWEAMPSKKDRIFGSEQYVAMIRSYTIKNKSKKDDQKMSVEEIAKEIESKDNLKAAYKALGLSSSEVNKARIKVKKKK